MNRRREALLLLVIVALLIFVPNLAYESALAATRLAVWVYEHVDIRVLGNGHGA